MHIHELEKIRINRRQENYNETKTMIEAESKESDIISVITTAVIIKQISNDY